MSTDPTGLGNDNCVNATKKIYINVQFDKDDWCGYEGECLIDNMVYDKISPCLLCKHRKPIDVPCKLDLRMKERENILWRNFK